MYRALGSYEAAMNGSFNAVKPAGLRLGDAGNQAAAETLAE
jgi:hypothetical protein